MIDDLIYRMDGMPVQQNRCYATAKEAIVCPVGNLMLVHDPLTGVVNNAAFNPDLMIYDENYQNEQGYSAAFVQHLYQVIQIIRPYFSGKSILEIGCGKGRFLNLMSEQGFSIIGIDPAYEGDAPNIVRKEFSSSLGFSADAIILRHVLEHISNPSQFLSSILEANGGEGLIYIEVPCLDWISDHRAWFDIFYEHVNYFRLSDFSRMFGTIIESGRLFGGQYLYLVADLSALRTHPAGVFHRFRLPSDFQDGIDRAIATIKNHKGRKNILWGAASKGVIFAFQLLHGGGLTMDFAIDVNPAKQGKYLPVTGLPVVSPHSGLSKLKTGDAIFVMNSNYFTEIRSLAGNNFTYYKVDQNDF